MKFGQSCQLPLWKWYDGINEEVLVEEDDVLLKFLHPIDPSVYLHWHVTDVKCWVPVNCVLQFLSILAVNTSGHPYTFLKSEFKDTQKQFTENLWTWKHNFMHLPMEINLFFNFKQFDHHWKLLKTLDFNTYQGFLFLFFIQKFLAISMNLYMK